MENESMPVPILVFVLAVFLSAMIFVGVMAITIMYLSTTHPLVATP